jgi:DNA polymerase type B, organellar and viral
MPYKDPEMRRAVNRASTAKGRRLYPHRRLGENTRAVERSRVKRLSERPFVGVDGEGGDIPVEGQLFGARHEYLLLRAGEYKLETGRPLTARDWLPFLADLPKDATYVSYYFDYDVTMMLRTLPVERARRIGGGDYGNGGVRVGPFEVGYRKGSEFRVRRGGAEPGPYTVINDVGSFFQSSFVNTLNLWGIGTQQDRDEIAQGKLLRSQFTDLAESTEVYNRLEIKLLEELMDEFAGVCSDVGYLPSRWQGPGQLASSVLRAHGVPKSKELSITSNRLLMSLANEAYYGGRFENTAHGPVSVPVYQYDINSAYPHAMRSLPCLVHGSFIRRRERPAPGSLWFGQCNFIHGDDMTLCHLPVRTKDGGLVFPRQASGTYWSVEIEAAERAGAYVELWGHAYEYVKGKTCDCKPFDFINELYDQRVALGKSAKGKVVKLAMNSLYGKMAQSVGKPPYANPVWASLITAMTRAQIVDACALNPGTVIMIATDAVFTLDPLPLDCGPGLGRWDLAEHPNGLMVVQPGVYFSGDTAQRSKTRGVNVKVLEDAREEFDTAWQSLSTHGFEFARYKVTVPVTQFITMRQALAWNRPEMAGVWHDTTRSVSFEIRPKRAGMPRRVDGVWRSTAPSGGPSVVSVPYGRTIGGGTNPLIDLRAAMNEQPDFTPLFLAP